MAPHRLVPTAARKCATCRAFAAFSAANASSPLGCGMKLVSRAAPPSGPLACVACPTASAAYLVASKAPSDAHTAYQPADTAAVPSRARDTARAPARAADHTL